MDKSDGMGWVLSVVLLFLYFLITYIFKLDDHPFANMWSNAAKKVIAGELYEAVMKDSLQERGPSRWRENIEFKRDDC